VFGRDDHPVACAAIKAAAHAATSEAAAVEAVLLSMENPDGAALVRWAQVSKEALLLRGKNHGVVLPVWLSGARLEEDDFHAQSSWSYGDPPKWYAENWGVLRDWLSLHPGHDFWICWYEAALAGRPLTGDWESHAQLLTDIALIPDADWESGAEHVAGLIAEIERKYQPSEADRLSDALPMVETVAVNPETGLFHTIPQPLQNPPLIGAVLSRVQDALEDALRGHNCITENSREFRVVTRVVTRYGNDPQRIEMDFTDLVQGMRRQFEIDDLPRTEDNLALFGAIEDGVRAIRATHPEVATNRALLAVQVMAELTPQDRTLLEEVVPLLEAICDPPMAEDFREDIAEMLVPRLPGAYRFTPGGKAPALPGEVRTFSRAAKVSLSERLDEVCLAVDSAPKYKGLRIVTTTASLADLLYRLVHLGLKIFGVL